MAVASLGNSDGTAGVVTATHTYSTAGIYTIQVTVDGNTYDESADVAPSPVAIVGLDQFQRRFRTAGGLQRDERRRAGPSFYVAIIARPTAGGADTTLETYFVNAAADRTMGYHEINIPPSFAAWPSGQVYLEAEAVVDGQSANSATLLDGRSGPPWTGIRASSSSSAPSKTATRSPSASAGHGPSGHRRHLEFAGPLLLRRFQGFAYGYGADDLIWAAYGVNVPMNVYAGASADILDDNTAADTLVGGPGSWISDSAGTNDSSYTTSGSTSVVLETDSNNDGTINGADDLVKMGPGCSVYVNATGLQPVDVQHNGRQRRLPTGSSAVLSFGGDGTIIEVFDGEENQILSGSSIGVDNNGLATTVYVEALSAGSSVLTLSLEGTSLYDQRELPQSLRLPRCPASTRTIKRPATAAARAATCRAAT